MAAIGANTMDVYNWSAKRAGAAVTIHGLDADGKPVKLVGIKSIFPNATATAFGAVLAIDRTETRHRLMLRS